MVFGMRVSTDEVNSLERIRINERISNVQQGAKQSPLCHYSFTVLNDKGGGGVYNIV